MAKKRVSISVDEDAVEKARQLGLNLSEITETALKITSAIYEAASNQTHPQGAYASAAFVVGNLEITVHTANGEHTIATRSYVMDCIEKTRTYVQEQIDETRRIVDNQSRRRLLQDDCDRRLSDLVENEPRITRNDGPWRPDDPYA